MNNTNEIKYIPMYKSYIDAVAQLSNEDKLEFYEAIFSYGFTGIEPTFQNPYLKMGWNLVKPNLDNNINTVLKNQENGKKGGRPAKVNKVEKEHPSIQEQPKVSVTSNNNVNDAIVDVKTNETYTTTNTVENVVYTQENTEDNRINLYEYLPKLNYNEDEVFDIIQYNDSSYINTNEIERLLKSYKNNLVSLK